MAQGFEFAAPTTEEMTRVAAVGVGAGVTGAVEGVIVSMAPKLGAMEPLLTWGALLGVPAVGAAGALMTKGILADLSMGIAAGGAGILGYTLPAMLQAFTARKPADRAKLTAEQRAALATGGDVKLLNAGLNAARLAQEAGARSVLEF